ncbi:hypothetical protein ROA7450_00734 [Roseovarius albus]|uniref:Cbb3-type cytochrome oxidase component FixQ n=1 Tax=Roseovarius albus TaxID=1247867 RepID=A0A1X6YGP3_9RHOB|nr:hypothetical protein ROA7450_00734 [Roseovarius albus]
MLSDFITAVAPIAIFALAAHFIFTVFDSPAKRRKRENASRYDSEHNSGIDAGDL